MRSVLEAGLFEDAVHRATRDFSRRMAGNGDASHLDQMLELAMAATRIHESPTVLLDASRTSRRERSVVEKMPARAA